MPQPRRRDVTTDAKFQVASRNNQAMKLMAHPTAKSNRGGVWPLVIAESGELEATVDITTAEGVNVKTDTAKNTDRMAILAELIEKKVPAMPNNECVTV